MAKGARSHTIKRNRANLRSKVFGPESDARTERLAAKLQEVASQPKEDDEQKESNMESTDGQKENADAAPSQADEDMDIDGGSSKNTTSTQKSRGSGRIHKRHKGRKSSIVFRTKSTMPKLGGKRK